MAQVDSVILCAVNLVGVRMRPARERQTSAIPIAFGIYVRAMEGCTVEVRSGSSAVNTKMDEGAELTMSWLISRNPMPRYGGGPWKEVAEPQQKSPDLLAEVHNNGRYPRQAPMRL